MAKPILSKDLLRKNRNKSNFIKNLPVQSDLTIDCIKLLNIVNSLFIEIADVLYMIDICPFATLEDLNKDPALRTIRELHKNMAEILFNNEEVA